jgi:hypothetical protein
MDRDEKAFILFVLCIAAVLAIAAIAYDRKQQHEFDQFRSAHGCTLSDTQSGYHIYRCDGGLIYITPR